ncbi:MAG TPA: twin-arginine translocase TatA/TatE family subunit [Allosphingosinicella sp.]|nr:twin-arginine translocase TatA/TatE family subunit [Allosphingosinicella sp.]
MGGFSLWHWLIVGLVILLLFGKGRFSDMMGDVAKGLKSFKKGMSEEDEVEQRRLTAERSAADRPIEARVEPRPASEPPLAEAPPAERGSASEADRH